MWTRRLLSDRDLARSLALVSIGIALPLEILTGLLAWHTVGEITSAVLLTAVLLNAGFAILVRFSPTVGVALAIGLALLLVPPQIAHGWRWVRLQEAAADLATTAWETRRRDGSFPARLPDPDPQLARHLSYGLTQDGRDFCVTYWISTRSTSHWYCSRGGGWGYYPD